MKFGRAALGTGILAVLLSTVAMGADGEYAIKIGRPLKPEMTFDVKVSGAMNVAQKVVADGKVVQDQKKTIGIELNGREKISDVDENGKEKIFTIVIDKCVDGDGKELLAKGDELTVEIGTGTIDFKTKSGKLSDDAKEALSVIFDKGTPSKKTDDEIFGTKDAKKVGDTWDADMKAAVSDLGIKLDPNNAKGSVTFKSLEKSQGMDCMRLTGNIVLDKIPSDEIPATFDIKESTMKMSMDTLLPTDTTKQCLEENMEMSFKQSASGEQEGKKIDFSASMNASKKRSVTAVK